MSEEPQVNPELQAAYDLLNKLHGSSETRNEFLKLIKKVDPDRHIPEVDISAPLEGKLEALQKQFDDYKAGIQKTQDEQSLEAARNRLREQGYTEEGLKDIEKLMVERRIADHDAAAAYYDKLHPAPAPEPPSYLGMNYEPENYENIVANPDKWLDTEVTKVVNEIRSGRN